MDGILYFDVHGVRASGSAKTRLGHAWQSPADVHDEIDCKGSTEPAEAHGTVAFLPVTHSCRDRR